ncbi:MAG: pyruvate synthase, partial [Candidatus Aminicenantes bacterium]|nr:pyruvate synthase [Candidatus Aminicenantes bacterium]
REDCIFIMNTTFDIPLIRERLKLGDRKIYALDAYTIARDELGRAIPNVPMVAALVKVLNLMGRDRLKEKIKLSLSKKLRKEVVEMNLRTVDRAFKEVKEG